MTQLRSPRPAEPHPYFFSFDEHATHIPTEAELATTLRDWSNWYVDALQLGNGMIVVQSHDDQVVKMTLVCEVTIKSVKHGKADPSIERAKFLGAVDPLDPPEKGLTLSEQVKCGAAMYHSLLKPSGQDYGQLVLNVKKSQITNIDVGHHIVPSLDTSNQRLGIFIYRRL